MFLSCQGASQKSECQPDSILIEYQNVRWLKNVVGIPRSHVSKY